MAHHAVDGPCGVIMHFGSAPRAHADREHRWRHIEHLLFECPSILGTGGTLAVKLLRDDLYNACFGSDHASAVLLAAFPSDRTHVVAATAYNEQLGQGIACRYQIQGEVRRGRNVQYAFCLNVARSRHMLNSGASSHVQAVATSAQMWKRWYCITVPWQPQALHAIAD